MLITLSGGIAVPRPRRFRWVRAQPNSTYFKPRGVPLASLEETVLTVDEHEAIRLADLQGLQQEEAARKMSISRATFGRIVASARKKIADAIINAKAIRIEGGDFVMAGPYACEECHHTWELHPGVPVPPVCPSCEGIRIGPVGWGGGSGHGRGWRIGKCIGRGGR
jgi:predicted DNA-binding protein (UPF0251 family)